MNNCLLCSHCDSDGEYEEGYFSYYCCERELDNDNRFPYKNTKCKKYKNDTSLVSLCNKRISKKLWDRITWKIPKDYDDYI